MAEKTLSDRWKSVEIIVSTVNLYAAAAAAELAKLFAPVLADGEVLPDWELDQKLKARHLRWLWDQLDISDRAVDDNGIEQVLLRRQRDAARQDVSDWLLGVKRSLTGSLGTKAAARVPWLRGELPRHWIDLEKEAEHVRRSLVRMKPRRRADALDFDPAVWTKALKKLAKLLKEVTRKLQLTEKAGESLAAQRRAALKRYEEGFVHIAGELEDTYRLTGLDLAADLVRPSKKYPWRTLAEIRQLGKAGSRQNSDAARDDEAPT